MHQTRLSYEFNLYDAKAWLVLLNLRRKGSMLLIWEHIETVMVEDNDVEYDDRLGDLVYSKGNRLNLEAFGLSSDQISASKIFSQI